MIENQAIIWTELSSTAATALATTGGRSSFSANWMLQKLPCGNCGKTDEI